MVRMNSALAACISEGASETSFGSDTSAAAEPAPLDRFLLCAAFLASLLLQGAAFGDGLAAAAFFLAPGGLTGCLCGRLGAFSPFAGAALCRFLVHDLVSCFAAGSGTGAAFAVSLAVTLADSSSTPVSASSSPQMSSLASSPEAALPAAK